MESKYITFYSYKGGSGRSTTLVNTARHLVDILHADPDHPILLVDADLESAGLTYFFHCENRFTARFSSTLHAEKFLNTPKTCFGSLRNNTFARSDEYPSPLEKWNLTERLAKLFPDFDVETMLEDVKLRDTIGQIFSIVVEAAENCKQARMNGKRVDKKSEFLNKAYDLEKLMRRLGGANSAIEKRKTIEGCLPTDSVVDVSDYFGKEEGTVKFIGADVAFVGVQSVMDNDTALDNKCEICRVFGEEGYAAILFDCGAGVQSTAHILNYISDVMVYCMRPTLQFVKGTKKQLENYKDCLEKTAENKPDKQKSVILLPTAVPWDGEIASALSEKSFWAISDAANVGTFIDRSFCTYPNSLHEVSVFKWREIILGAEVIDGDDGTLSPEIAETLSCYKSYNTMPKDAQRAYETYKMLAERIVEHAPIMFSEG